jgi:hypothetical protein
VGESWDLRGLWIKPGLVFGFEHGEESVWLLTGNGESVGDE